MTHALLKNRAAAQQIKLLGRALLHVKSDGTTEWLWGQFKAPMDKGLSGNDFDFTVSVPVIRMMQADAIDVCVAARRSHLDNAQSSRIRVSGYEYTVTNRHNYDNGTVHIELAKDCKPILTPMAAPSCDTGCASDNAEPVINFGQSRACGCLQDTCSTCRHD